jgi:peptide/nickel transport system substrate-binding protein
VARPLTVSMLPSLLAAILPSLLTMLPSLASAETRPAYGGSAQAALASGLTAIDPLSGEPGDLEAALLVYDGLFRVEGGKPRPHLALSLENAELHARVTLRSDVKLHDGTPLRAAEVAASVSRALKSPAGWMLAPITGVRAAGDDVVELQLARPAPDLPLLLSTTAALIVPAQKNGSGPFVPDKQDHDGVVLHAFAEHFAGRPYLDKLNLRSYGSATEEAGAYEIGALQASRHGVSAGGAPRHPATVTDGATGITVFLAIGAGVPLAHELYTALSAGLDRERLRRLAGAPSVSVHPPNLPRVSLPPPRPRLGLLVDQSRFEHRALADRLLAELARIGVDGSIELVDAATYHARREGGQYELLLGDALPPVADAGLAELAVLAAVDPAAARALLAKAPAATGQTPGERNVPLVRRGARLSHASELRGVTVDSAGRVGWADAHWKAR